MRGKSLEGESTGAARGAGGAVGEKARVSAGQIDGLGVASERPSGVSAEPEGVVELLDERVLKPAADRRDRNIHAELEPFGHGVVNRERQTMRLAVGEGDVIEGIDRGGGPLVGGMGTSGPR